MEKTVKIRKVFLIFILVLTGILFAILVFLSKASAGGVNLDFEIPDQKTDKFAREFMSEIVKKKIFINQFVGYYCVRGFLGATRDNETGQTRTCIGIFIDDEEQPIIKVWFDDLFSMEEIQKKARETANYVFQFLKIRDEKKKRSIKIPV